MADLDDDLPLADHPAHKPPKAGDPDVRKERDRQHYAAHSSAAVSDAVRRNADAAHQPTLPEDAPIMAAWRAFQKSDNFSTAVDRASHPEHRKDALWRMFMAGWTARDAQS